MHELAFGVTSNNQAFGPGPQPARSPAVSPVAAKVAGGSPHSSRPGWCGQGWAPTPAARCVSPRPSPAPAGLRPTLKRYSQEGITPIAHTRDTAGPMARTVGDLVLLDNVITGAKDKVITAKLKGLRIGVHKGYYFDGLDAETEKLTLAAIDKLKAAGAEIVEVDMPALKDLDDKVSFPVALFEANVDLAKYLKKFGIPIDVNGVAAQIKSPDVKGVFDGMVVPGAQKAIPPEAYKAALATRRKLQKLMADTFAQEQDRRDRFSHDADARGADRGRRDDQAQRPGRADLPDLHPELRSRVERGHPWHYDSDRAHTSRTANRARARRPGGQRPQIAFDRARTGAALRPAAGTLAHGPGRAHL